ncbi:MAG: hypothetical protein R6V28_01755 [Nitriliruptoraceae bacterium]
MAEPTSTQQIERTVAQVQRSWYRAAVPRRVRRRRAEELHAHLLDMVRAGRDIEAVVGEDLELFAAEWAAAERRHPVAELLLQVVASLTLLPGVAALLNPWVHEVLGVSDDRVGIPVGFLALLAIMVPFFTSWQVIRFWRHRLDTRTSTLLTAGSILVYAIALAVWIFWGRSTDELIPLSTPAAGSLTAVGVAAIAISNRLKRP